MLVGTLYDVRPRRSDQDTSEWWSRDSFGSTLTVADIVTLRVCIPETLAALQIGVVKSGLERFVDSAKIEKAQKQDERP